MKGSIFFLLALCFFITCCTSSRQSEPQTAEVTPSVVETSLPVDRLRLPEGFRVSVFAEGVENARSMDLSPEGTLFVGTRKAGNVYALRDTNQDFRADVQYLLASGLNMPNGVALREGDLYVAEVDRILKYEDIENHLEEVPEPVVVYDKYPDISHHGWKYIAFGPDDKLYVPVGAPCNICESEDRIFNSITRLNPDGSGFEIVQEGVRNTVGFTWHPDTGELWFTDNGRDWMGDDMPACELNRAERDGLHFGYPYCHQGDTPDPDFGKKRSCSEFIPPAQNLGAHVAPLGLEFYTGNQFPTSYSRQIFIAEHGSWNRSKKIGYRVALVRLQGNTPVSYESFAEGWLEDEEVWGRPVDIELLPDGSMLVSDDYADAIYRIYYEG